MPEIEKGQILDPERGSHTPRIEDENLLCSTKSTDNLLMNKRIDEENEKKLFELNDRPFTAPPSLIPRTQLRAYSEPLNLYHNNNKKFFNDTNMTQAEENNIINSSATTMTIASAGVVPNNENNKFNISACDIRNDIELKSQSEINLRKDEFSFSDNCVIEKSDDIKSTWHQHVYAQPPKRPTPHTIGDILGWQCPQRPKPIRPGQTTDLFINPDSEISPLNQLLNVRLKPTANSVDDEFRQKYQTNFNNHFIPRSSSMSESSEDDSCVSDQPLNLSISKSRDTSPSPSIGKSAGKLKKGKRGKGLWSIFLVSFKIFLKYLFHPCSECIDHTSSPASTFNKVPYSKIVPWLLDEEVKTFTQQQSINYSFNINFK